MDDLARVRVGDRVGNGADVRQQRQPVLEPLRLGDDVAQRVADDQLHRQERQPVRPPPGLVHADDRRVLQPRADQRLALEPRRVDRVVGEQLLDRDRAAEPAVERDADAPHPAAGDLVAELVVARVDDRQASTTAAAAAGSRSVVSVGPATGAGGSLAVTCWHRGYALATRPTTTVMLSSPPRLFASSIRVSGRWRYQVIATMRSSSPCST